MAQPQDWSIVQVPDIESLPKTVFLRKQDLLARQRFPVHRHNWNQFVYATSGTLLVTIGASWYVITPEQAIWIPTGTAHTTAALNEATFRNLYVAESPMLTMPVEPTVYCVTDLLKSLISELERVGEHGANERYGSLLDEFVCAQLPRLSKMGFNLPWPQSALLGKICGFIHAHPADDRSLTDWADAAGLSGRTLARRFVEETGITYRDWRHRLRLILAMEWLCAGRSVTTTALDLGYSTTSAFTFMFRTAMGVSPTEWRTRQTSRIAST